MPISIHTADAAPGATGSEAGQDAPGQDDWRSGGLPALRRELDRIDDAIHDLLMRRAGVVEHVARSGKPAAFRPGREAAIIRRLLARHRGALPAVTLARIWREMLAGTTAMQGGGFSLAVADTGTGLPLAQLAREHFGALTPLRVLDGAGRALADVGQGHAAVAVLPYPSETDPWWVSLPHHEPRLHIIARLPFWRDRPDGAVRAQAVVVAATQADASGEDRSFLGLECDGDVSRTRLCGELAAAGLRPETMVLLRPAGSAAANVLVETEGFLTDDDPRLSRLAAVPRRPVVLGNYAVPVGGR